MATVPCARGHGHQSTLYTHCCEWGVCTWATNNCVAVPSSSLVSSLTDESPPEPVVCAVMGLPPPREPPPLLPQLRLIKLLGSTGARPGATVIGVGGSRLSFCRSPTSSSKREGVRVWRGITRPSRCTVHLQSTAPARQHVEGCQSWAIQRGRHHQRRWRRFVHYAV